MHKRNYMKDEIIDDVKREASSGISKVISSIFDTLIQPILNLIPTLARHIQKKREEKKIRKTMNFIVHSNLLHNYLDARSLDCIVFRQHNGLKSGTFGFRYIRPVFVNISHNDRNDLLKLFTEHSSPIHLYDTWMYKMASNRNIYKENYTPKEQSFFDKYNTICYRKHESNFYIILCSHTIPTDNEEYYIKELIEKLIENSIK